MRESRLPSQRLPGVLRAVAMAALLLAIGVERARGVLPGLAARARGLRGRP